MSLERTNRKFDGDVSLDRTRVRAHVVGTFDELLDLGIGESDFLEGLLVDLVTECSGQGISGHVAIRTKEALTLSSTERWNPCKLRNMTLISSR